MEIKSINVIIFVFVSILLGSSMIGVGEMSDNQDDNDNKGWLKKIVKSEGWDKKILNFFDFSRFFGFMNSEQVGSEEASSEDLSSDELNSIQWICGNGIIDTDPQSTEECEPPNTATCDAFCHLKPYCGDGIINQPSEQCEPPNTATCDSMCKISPPRKVWVDMELTSNLVDPSNELIGDEYFDNLISECSFHSNEKIDANTCVICKIVDKKIEPCDDLFLTFTELPHGTILGNTEGFPNAVIPGVTITAVATTHSGGGKNAAIIFDGDTPGDGDESPTPDPDLRASGICPNCVGKHMVIIAENTAGGADGIVDSPDDNAQGGTQTWVFDEPWFVSSFDFVDYDNTSFNGKARAYDNPECSGTPVATVDIKAVPNGGNGSVQTIFMNANNVRCLQFEYKDSGGVTNVKLECIKKFDEGGLLDEGTLVLTEDYEPSTKLLIPLEHGVDITQAVGVKIALAKNVIDFAELSHGAKFDVIRSYLLDNFGIILDVDGFNGIDQAVIYNSFNVGGADTDLEHPLIPDDPSIGKLVVFRENSSNQPNDAAAGGIMRFRSFEPITVASVDVVDHENNGDTSVIKAYQTFDCTGPFVSGDILPLGDRTSQTVNINADNVRCLEIFYKDSGGFTNINLACAQIFENNRETIFMTGFEEQSEIGNWHKDNSRTTTPSPGSIIFGQASAGGSGGSPSGPHSGTKYLGGSGDIDDTTVPIVNPAWAAYNRDPIDISAYTNVVLSLWYSYEDTENTDNFALYYRVDGGPWIEILNIAPTIGNGNQKAWEQILVAIPDGNDLELEFRWETSANNDEHVMIDDVKVSGIPN